jgi:hypothetical protein
MSLTIAVSLLVCVVGAVVALVPSKLQPLGLYAFAVGLWWVLASVAGHVVRIGP